jgi:hypothetical protein
MVNPLWPAREFSQERSATFQALGRPALGSPIVFGDGGGLGRKRKPRLLRRGINVDVGRKILGFIERSDTQEANGLAGSGIVAPQGNFAYRAPGDPLTLAALGRRVDDGDVALQQLQSIRFDHGIECKRATGLSLAPTAVTAMNE